ncbi:nuclear transport factor 2 family protein, partial [Salmonella sp. SAL4457]|uniref:nuclear transport factor 2 family protein n=1 Tax=Salmonella sp. SAL4457 TaxID=3159912 RepID=UPI00397BCB87
MSSRASALVLLAFVAAPLRAQNSPASDEAQVRSVVESYLHGLKFNDVESLRKAFWPDAKLFFVDKKGSLGQLTQSQWYA